MPISFIKTNVTPGEPVTAQGWNGIVDAVDEVVKYLNGQVAGTVPVTITNGAPFDPATARVTATRNDLPPAEALRPIAPSTAFIFPRLAPGAWTVRVEAPGYTPATVVVTVSADGTFAPTPVSVALVASQPRMPYLLGKTLTQAAADPVVAQLNPRILDATGKDLPRVGFDAAYKDAPVLMQWPDPGELAPPTGTQIVVAGKIQVSIATVPKVTNMSFSAAKTLLEGLGLKIEEVE